MRVQEMGIRWERRVASHRILIAGAGIGGLTAGASLLQAGHDVTIFEQASELSEVGAGLQISANATHVLHHLGLGAPLAEVGVRLGAYVFRLHDTGEEIHRFALPAYGSGKTLTLNGPARM